MQPMDSPITRKEFCKHFALSSLVAAAYPALDSPSAHASGEVNETQSASGVKQSSTQPVHLPDQDLVISVKNYGAKGDGVTDDTAQIQRAMQSNSLIFFPAGSYRVSKAIQLNSLQNVHIWATGATLINTTLNNHCFQIDQCEFVTITGANTRAQPSPMPLGRPTTIVFL